MRLVDVGDQEPAVDAVVGVKRFPSGPQPACMNRPMLVYLGGRALKFGRNCLRDGNSVPPLSRLAGTHRLP